jgi:hypothetical protein
LDSFISFVSQEIIVDIDVVDHRLWHINLRIFRVPFAEEALLIEFSPLFLSFIPFSAIICRSESLILLGLVVLLF